MFLWFDVYFFEEHTIRDYTVSIYKGKNNGLKVGVTGHLFGNEQTMGSCGVMLLYPKTN